LFTRIKMDTEKSDAHFGNYTGELTTIDGFSLPSIYEELRKEIENLEVSERDVWICGFPRSGNHFY
jgi:hypothetical protein